MQWIATHYDLIAYVLGGLLGISEGLPVVRGTKAEGILHGLSLLFKKPEPPIQQPDSASGR